MAPRRYGGKQRSQMVVFASEAAPKGAAARSAQGNALVVTHKSQGHYARLRAFPPQAVLGPAFMPGRQRENDSSSGSGCKSRGAAAVNSQGRKPLDAMQSHFMSPEGATVALNPALLSPLRGFRDVGATFQGLTPLAIDCRPFGAFQRTSKDRASAPRSGRAKMIESWFDARSRAFSIERLQPKEGAEAFVEGP